MRPNRSRWLVIVGLVLMMGGVLDPLEGSVVILAGSVLAALGVLAVNTLLSGVQFSMMTFSVATVLLKPSIGGALMGLAFAAAIGFFGGLAPAWRAAHLRVVDALRHA